MTRRKVTINFWALVRPYCWWKGSHDYKLGGRTWHQCRRCLHEAR